MTTLLTPDQTVFESEYCGRCGGSGTYSWNAIHGNRCYGCNGQGVALTKRGAAAMKHYHELQETTAGDVAVGSFIWLDNRWRKVLERREDELNDGRIYLVFPKNYSWLVFAQQKLRVVRNEDERKAQIKAAQEYQATLTKTGKPVKRVKAAA